MNTELNQLTAIELLILQKHLKLGKDHLQKRLSAQEISNLYHIEKIQEKTEKTLSIFVPELMGNMSLALNTTFTATLGAWSGLSGLLKFSLSINTFFGLLGVCTIIGAWVGINNYKIIKKTTQDALEKRQNMAAQTRIINLINQQRAEEIETKTNEINQILKNLQIEGNCRFEFSGKQQNESEICLVWLNKIENNLSNLAGNDEIEEAFMSELEIAKKSLENAMAEHRSRNEGKMLAIIHKLSDVPLQPQPSFKGWLKTNFRKIIVSVTPVFLGGGAALFVYLGGAPKLAKDSHLSGLADFLNLPEVKYIEIAIVCCITLYFSAASLYMNHQAFKRDQELSNAKILLAREENKLDLLDDRLLKIKHMSEIVKPFRNLHRFLRQLISS